MQDKRDGYGGGGDVGYQHMICGTTEMAKWVVRTAVDWENIDYLTLKPKTRKKTYQYDHHVLLLILIYINLFRKVFLNTIHVP